MLKISGVSRINFSSMQLTLLLHYKVFRQLCDVLTVKWLKTYPTRMAFENTGTMSLSSVNTSIFACIHFLTTTATVAFIEGVFLSFLLSPSKRRRSPSLKLLKLLWGFGSEQKTSLFVRFRSHFSHPHREKLSFASLTSSKTQQKELVWFLFCAETLQ